MQKAEVVFDALHSLGTKNLPLRRAYRLLFNPHIYAGPADRRLTYLIQDLKTQRFRWGRDAARDELVHSALVRILTRYVAGRDGRQIHGLRAGTGIHSALKGARVVAQRGQWLGIWHLRELPALRPDKVDAWFAGKVEDRRFLDLLFHFLQYRPQPEATPRSLFTQSWIPGSLHGVCHHLVLQELDGHLASLASATAAARDGASSPLRYVRYMNWLLAAGNGPKDEAARWSQEISALVQSFAVPTGDESAGLRDVTRIRTPMRFLGYDLAIASRGKVSLRLSAQSAAEMCRPFQVQGKPAGRGERTPLPDAAICDLYAQEFGAFAQFYALAENRRRLGGVQATLRSSLWRTLAQKRKCRVREVARNTELRDRGRILVQKVGKTQFQVNRIDDVRWIDPQQTLVGEPCAVKVACTVRREAQH